MTFSRWLCYTLPAVFVSYDDALMDMTVRAFMIYPFSFLLSSVAIFGSAFFTALNDGLTSAIISFPRTLVFQTAAFRIAYRKKYEYC